MPTLTITTNIAKSRIPDGFLKKTAQLVAELLSKPLSIPYSWRYNRLFKKHESFPYVVVHIIPDQMMSWGGTDDPCAFATLGSIGSLGRSQNAKISNKLSAHVKETLGVNPDRMYINFVDYQRENVGYVGTTFADM